MLEMLVICWGAALLLLLLGLHVRNKRDPVSLWGGQKVAGSRVRNVHAYNRAVGKMYAIFSIPFWICGPVLYFYPAAAVAAFCLVCTLGFGLMAWYCHRIEEKYFLR